MEALAATVAGMDEEVVTVSVLDAAVDNDPELKLEALKIQEELIEEEREQAEAAEAEAMPKKPAPKEAGGEGSVAAGMEARAAPQPSPAEVEASLERVTEAERAEAERAAAAELRDAAARDAARAERERLEPAEAEALRALAGAVPAKKKAAEAPAAEAQRPERVRRELSRDDEAVGFGDVDEKSQIEEAAAAKRLKAKDVEVLEQLMSDSAVEQEKGRVAEMLLLQEKRELEKAAEKDAELEELVAALEEHDFEDTGSEAGPTDPPPVPAAESLDEATVLRAERALERAEAEAAPDDPVTAPATDDADRDEQEREEDIREEIEEMEEVQESMEKAMRKSLTKLQRELSMADRAIGDSLNILDPDKDGVASAEEVSRVVASVLKHVGENEEDIAEVMRLLDHDADGKVTKSDLEELADKLKQIEEERAEKAGGVTKADGPPGETSKERF
jgi:hypothetical protein